MRYAKSRLEINRREIAYRIFVTDCLGHVVGTKTRYVDMIQPRLVETRSSEEIIGNISDKLAKLAKLANG